jgi:hypothetical protein
MARSKFGNPIGQAAKIEAEDFRDYLERSAHPTQPPTPESMLATLGELRSLEEGWRAHYSEKGDQKNVALIDGFLAHLREQAHALEAQIEGGAS